MTPAAELMLADILATCHSTPRAQDELEAILAACQRCPQYGQAGCTLGPRCDRWRLWRERIAHGDCPHFDS
jgi:hypothetical protein